MSPPPTAPASSITLRPSARTTAARMHAKYDLPFVQMVDTKGEMCGGTPWDGVFVKKADPHDARSDLDEARPSLCRAPGLTHSYPFCWRCDTPLIYYARSTWFISHDRGKGQADRLQPPYQLDPRNHQGRPHGQLPGERHRLGHLPRALLGHPPARMGMRQVRQDTRRRQP